MDLESIMQSEISPKPRTACRRSLGDSFVTRACFRTLNPQGLAGRTPASEHLAHPPN